MKSFEHVVMDPVGIHARPAGLLAKEAKQYTSSVTIKKDSMKADAKKLMQLMGLGVKTGEKIEIEIDGKDEEVAYESLKTFFLAHL